LPEIGVQGHPILEGADFESYLMGCLYRRARRNRHSLAAG